MLPIYPKKITKLLKIEKNSNSLINSCNFGYKYIAPEISNKTRRVLEVGSGSGLLLALLSTNHKKISFDGVDPNIEGFSIFNNIKKKLIKEYKLQIHQKINSNKLDKKKYDLIFSVDVLEHVDDIDHLFFLIKNKLSKNGKFIVICPNYDFFYEPHFNIPVIFNKNYTYKIFGKKILNDERSNLSSGLWKSLNFITIKKLKKITEKHYMNIKLKSELSVDLIMRIYNDENFKIRKFKVWLIAYFLVNSSLIKLLKLNSIINYLPYIHAEITLKTK